jgi:uncharacterized membrane protein
MVAPEMADASRAGMLQLARLDADGIRWRLTRNCALTPTQCGWAFALAAAASMGVAGVFWWLGAPFVLPFALLETVALGLGFLWYARHATDRETLVLDAERLLVEIEEAGAVQRRELARQWLRVEEVHGSGLVGLRTGAAQVWVGRHARPEQRRQLARELRWALQAVPATGAQETLTKP